MSAVNGAYRAVVAVVGALSTAVAAVAADPDVTGLLPQAPSVIAAIGAALTTALVFLRKNQPTVEEAEALVDRARQRAGV